MIKQPELLVPAGTVEKMKYALAYGADAVYAGVPQFSLRARENDFRLRNLAEAVEYVHRLGKKIYMTMNIFPHNRKIASFLKMLDLIAAIKPDGLILADPGMIMLTRERHPGLDLHLSTQANAINWATVKFWHSLGLKRIILSRELLIEEIAEIKQHVPEIELESFVHGAICMAYSGRCLLSNYFNHRDANQGTCTNACRWEYKVWEEPAEMQEELDQILPQDKNYFLEDPGRPGSLMPVYEDEHGTYIMNAKDLSAIGLLRRMTEAGIDSFKVEGRTKSAYYVSTITRAYRQAIDAISAGADTPEQAGREVYAVANRGYVTGFLEKNPLAEGQNYESGHSGYQTHQFVALIDDWDEGRRLARIRVRNRFEAGQILELVQPAATIPFTVDFLCAENGSQLSVAHGGGMDVWIQLPVKPEPFAILRRPLVQQERTAL